MMRNLSLFCLLIILTGGRLLHAQAFDPENYSLQDSTLNLKVPQEFAKDQEVTLFEKNLIWYGIKDERVGPVRIILRHSLTSLNEDAAVEKNNKIYLSVNQGDSLVNLQVRVIQDGKVVKSHTREDTKIVQEEENTYRILAIEGLKKGQLVEVLIVRMVSYSEHGSLILQHGEKVLNSYFSLACPENVRFALKSYPTQIQFNDTIINEIRYQSAQPGFLEEFKDEDYCFENARKFRIEYTLERNFSNNKKFNSWADKGRNLMEALHKYESKDVKAIKSLIKKEKWDKLDRKQQPFHIESWVKSNIKMEKSMPFIDKMDELIKLKYCDMYSGVKLYMLLFQEMQIPYELVITLEKSSKFFDQEFPSSNYLVDILFHLPESKEFFDPLDVTNRMGDIHHTYLGQGALFIKPVQIGEQWSGITRLGKIPEVSPESVVRQYRIGVSFKEEGETEIITKYSGSKYSSDGFKMIYSFAGKEKADEILEEGVRRGRKNGQFEIVAIRNANINDFGEYYKPVEMEYRWKSDVFTDNANEKILFKLGEMIGPQMELYDKPTRTNPVDMHYGHIQDSQIELEIPAGYTIKGFDGMAKSFHFTDSSGRKSCGIDIKTEVKGNKFILSIYEYYNKSEYSTAEYADFRTVINAAADINKYTLVLEKTP